MSYCSLINAQNAPLVAIPYLWLYHSRNEFLAAKFLRLYLKLMVSCGVDEDFYNKQSASMVEATCLISSCLLVFANSDFASITNKAYRVGGYMAAIVTRINSECLRNKIYLFFSIWYELLPFPYHLRAPVFTMKLFPTPWYSHFNIQWERTTS